MDAAALKQTIANVVAQLSSVLAAIGAPAGYDPFTTAITAATASGAGNTADQLLDIVKVVKDPATGKPPWPRWTIRRRSPWPPPPAQAAR